MGIRIQLVFNVSHLEIELISVMKVNLRYQNSFANDADININIVLTNILFFTYVSDLSKNFVHWK